MSKSISRNKFMTLNDDGIEKAETIIKNYGGIVNKGLITPVETQSNEFWEACEFLIDEWDYAFIDK